MTAIKAEYVNYKRLPTRKTLQIILEVAEENQRAVFSVLGFPDAGESIWVDVTPITEAV